MITIGPSTTRAAVGELRESYFGSIAGPPEAYIEELISCDGAYHTLHWQDSEIGYVCVGGGNRDTLLQFHVGSQYLRHAETAFSHLLLGEGLFSQALVLTRDHLAVSLCMALNTRLAVECYVFEEGPVIPRSAPHLTNTVLRGANAADIPAIRAAVGDFHDFLHYTLEASVAAQDIYVLLSDGVVLGTGVIGAKEFRPPYVDIGMCVAEQHRRQGIGTQILVKLREECQARGWIAAASCQYENIASKKTLESAGMVTKERVLRVSF
jgi:GNAT superfamily N-acetyltransferase